MSCPEHLRCVQPCPWHRDQRKMKTWSCVRGLTIPWELVRSRRGQRGVCKRRWDTRGAAFVPEGTASPTWAARLQATAEVSFSSVMAHGLEPGEGLMALLGLRKSLRGRDAPWAVTRCSRMFNRRPQGGGWGLTSSTGCFPGGQSSHRGKVRDCGVLVSTVQRNRTTGGVCVCVCKKH